MSTSESHESHSAGHRRTLKSAGQIGFLTAISRVLGFVRDLVIAAAFGTGLGAEAFVVSFKIPNLLRDLVGEGAANAAIVPVLTECREKHPRDFWPLVSTLLVTMACVLLVLTLLGVCMAPWIVQILAPGFAHSADPDKYPLTVRLTRVIFPYIFLIGLSALCMGVLNSLKEFKSSAFGPILMNCCMIAAGFFLEKRYGPMALVFGVLTGGAMQLAWQVRPLKDRGFTFTKPVSRHGYSRRIIKLLIPRALGSAIYQINVFVDSILASFEKIVGVGGQSALYYSNRLFQLPLAIFGLSLAQALLPTFSGQVVREDREGFRRTFSMAVRSLIFVAAPAGAGLLAMCRPIIRTIFERGRFDAYSTAITSGALFFYAFGLVSCCLVKVMVNAFYAMQDTRTPVKVMAGSVALNVALSLVLMRSMKLSGLTLASSISATINMAVLYAILRKRAGPFEEKKILALTFKVLLASAVMAIVCVSYAGSYLPDARPIGSTGAAAGRLAAGIVLGILVYLGTCFLLRVEEMKKGFSWMSRRPA